MEPIQGPIPLGMMQGTPNLPTAQSMSLPDPNAKDPGLDEQDIVTQALYDFKNDIRDKEDFGWLFKRQYDIRAYYGIKNAAMQNWPYPGASAYPTPITPTLLDTGWANLRASMEGKNGDLIEVKGVGKEDKRRAKILQRLMNWQVTNDIPVDEVLDAAVFRALLHGDGPIKVIQDFQRNSVKMFSFDPENLYLPIDASGFTTTDTDHVIQIIPLSINDINQRKLWGIYKDLDRMSPGVAIATAQATDLLLRERDNATGTNMEQRVRRETYYMMEYYKTYYPKSSSGTIGMSGGPSSAGVRPQEIIAWISPNGGIVHRISRNVDGVRPFARMNIYPNAGRFFSMSMPEKLKNIQEKADYADKQNTDALDRSIMPAGFTDDKEVFNAGASMRVPGGIYPLGSRGQTIMWEPQPPRDRGFEMQYQQMWVEAQQITGLIDISYGSNAKQDKTLGQSQMRSFRADIRFNSIYKRIERGWKQAVDLLYHYDNQFMPRSTKLSVIGFDDLKTIDELFPKVQGEMGLGMEGKFDFAFAGESVTDREQTLQNDLQLCTNLLMNPLVSMDRGNLWRVTQRLAETLGETNLETLITKPKEAYLISPEEAIERIMSGELDIQPKPGIDLESYTFELQLFMMSETFMNLSPQQQGAIQTLLGRVMVMQAAQRLAQIDMMNIQHGMAAQQAQVPGMPGQPQSVGNPGTPTPLSNPAPQKGIPNGQPTVH